MKKEKIRQEIQKEEENLKKLRANVKSDAIDFKQKTQNKTLHDIFYFEDRSDEKLWNRTIYSHKVGEPSEIEIEVYKFNIQLRGEKLENFVKEKKVQTYLVKGKFGFIYNHPFELSENKEFIILHFNPNMTGYHYLTYEEPESEEKRVLGRVRVWSDDISLEKSLFVPDDESSDKLTLVKEKHFYAPNLHILLANYDFSLLKGLEAQRALGEDQNPETVKVSDFAAEIEKLFILRDKFGNLISEPDSLYNKDLGRDRKFEITLLDEKNVPVDCEINYQYRKANQLFYVFSVVINLRGKEKADDPKIQREIEKKISKMISKQTFTLKYQFLRKKSKTTKDEQKDQETSKNEEQEKVEGLKDQEQAEQKKQEEKNSDIEAVLFRESKIKFRNFDFKEVYKNFTQDMKEKHHASLGFDPRKEIAVYNNDTVNSLRKIIDTVPPNFSIKFLDQLRGEDGSGLTRQFFDNGMKWFLSEKENKMFKLTPNGNYIFRCHDMDKIDVKLFKTIGYIVGSSFIKLNPFGVTLSSYIFKHMYGFQLSEEDLPNLFNSVDSKKTFEEQKKRVAEGEELSNPKIYYKLGAINVVKEASQHVDFPGLEKVNKSNWGDYCRAYADVLAFGWKEKNGEKRKSIKERYDEFRAGFNTAMNIDELRVYMNYTQCTYVMQGGEKKVQISPELIINKMEFDAEQAGILEINKELFLKQFRTLSSAKVVAFLKTVTGSSSFNDMNGNFRIDIKFLPKTMNAVGNSIAIHTCANQLELIHCDDEIEMATLFCQLLIDSDEFTAG